VNDSGYTVAITGPTGDIGRSLLRQLDKAPEVNRVIGMARRPFDPAALGLEKTEYRQGDILEPDSIAELVEGADVLVHLAFVILGSRDETHRINLEGTRNVFEAAMSGGVHRFVYTSSVAAYGFHDENPQPLTEEVAPKGTDDFYYSAQKAELERELHRLVDGSDVEAYIFRPCIVAGPDALILITAMIDALQLGGRLPQITKFLDTVPFLKPVLPGPGSPFQLVHHDDVATALLAAVLGRGEPGVYNLAGPGELTMSDLASALHWYSVPMPEIAVDAAAELVARLPFVPAEAQWIEAVRTPVLMDTTKARRELHWRPQHDARETLQQMVDAARSEQLIR
jgi:nucleoside-diphosphate-sugar epimerase